jgi:hypothetical protein
MFNPRIRVHGEQAVLSYFELAVLKRPMPGGDLCIRAVDLRAIPPVRNVILISRRTCRAFRCR